MKIQHCIFLLVAIIAVMISSTMADSGKHYALIGISDKGPLINNVICSKDHKELATQTLEELARLTSKVADLPDNLKNAYININKCRDIGETREYELEYAVQFDTQDQASKFKDQYAVHVAYSAQGKPILDKFSTKAAVSGVYKNIDSKCSKCGPGCLHCPEGGKCHEPADCITNVKCTNDRCGNSSMTVSTISALAIALIAALFTL